MSGAHTTATTSLDDNVFIEVRTVAPTLLSVWFGTAREGAIYGTPTVLRRLRDRLSTALGDNGSARIVGAYQGSIVYVDDHGQHLVSDDLVELDSCRLCVDQPATTTNDQGEPTCLAHA